MQRNPIKSASRALQVLELFNEVRTPLRQNDIFRRLCYPQSSATALLKSMAMLGYLNYDRASRTYFPTTRVAALGDWITHSTFGPGRLLELMRDLRDRTGETVTVASRNDMFVQYLHVVVPEHTRAFPQPLGSMRLLPHSSGGLVLLSQMADKAVAKLCRHIDVHTHGTAPRIDTVQLFEQLEWVRHRGYCFLAGLPIQEIASIAFPLSRQPHSIPLAIGIGGGRSLITRKKSLIVEAASGLIQAYGAS